jgi:secreted trypsin-like serine protease
MGLRRRALFGALSLLCWTPILGWTALPTPSLAQEACRDPRRIVGGEETNIKEHPWQVALDVDGELCGGVIIEKNWVLTAAHCFASNAPAGVRIKAGATDNRIGGVWNRVQNVFRHEKYNTKTKENDLALVKLVSPPTGTAIALAKPGLELPQCEQLEVTGWGRTADGKGGAADKLRKAMVPYVDSATCNERQSYNGKILPGMMCAGFHEVDACQGDSGGPLVLKGPDGPVLVGIVSWGEGCGQKFKYGVYTRVSAYRDWIAKITSGQTK